MSNDHLERRIAVLERTVFPLPRRVHNLGVKLGQTAQKIQGLRAGASYSSTTLNGRIIGGLTVTRTPMPDVTLRVEGGVTAIDYGTYPVPTGIYSLTIGGIDPADTTLNLYPTGPSSPRFAGASPLAWAQAISVGNVNAAADVIPPSSPSYVYNFESSAGSAACLYPIAKALEWDDSRFGIGTATDVGVGAPLWFSACFITSSFLNGLCAAQATTPVQMQLDQFMRTFIAFKTANPLNNCPVNLASCSGVSFDRNVQVGGVFISAQTQPSFDLTTKFSRTWSGSTNQPFHNSAPRTQRWYEP